MVNVETPKAVSKEKLCFSNISRPVLLELRKQTKGYFDETGKETTGNSGLYLKAFSFLAVFFICYLTILFRSNSFGVALSLYAIMGFAAAALGFNLMHDGAHGSFSKKKWLNTLAAYSINLLGGDAVLWKNKHNMIHHTYTNIEGYDQDIAQMPVFRLNTLQKKSYLHRFQHWYSFFIYGLSSLLWVFLLDYQKYFSGKIGNLKISNFKTSDHIVFWITKVGYLVAYLIVPAIFNGWLMTLTGFLVFHFVLGLVLSVVFQLAHVVENTEFSEPPTEGKVEDEWAVHQLKTTSNFATRNKFVTWYTGGLNFQVEHHLFPNISHVHYPELNKIVKRVCFELDVPYNEFPSFSSALGSHLAHLKETGRA
ncbi:fatty acid desaturase family protein [Sporocytophaga myxococcoides]|uniref:fatty acid desaturase family protein n=1 Tax=Sporocytophaga myxococcoides TaxID=153721 RepID=UPI000400ADB0|nr:acyl-CoA desaturase [Sporocytophaga myxococcoides]